MPALRKAKSRQIFTPGERSTILDLLRENGYVRISLTVQSIAFFDDVNALELEDAVVLAMLIEDNTPGKRRTEASRLMPLFERIFPT